MVDPRVGFDECPTDPGDVVALWAAYQSVCLLFERLAEDRFPDQAALDAWIVGQQGQMVRAWRRGNRDA